jgi:hypothetical protein
MARRFALLLAVLVLGAASFAFAGTQPSAAGCSSGVEPNLTAILQSLALQGATLTSTGQAVATGDQSSLPPDGSPIVLAWGADFSTVPGYYNDGGGSGGSGDTAYGGYICNYGQQANVVFRTGPGTITDEWFEEDWNDVLYNKYGGSAQCEHSDCLAFGADDPPSTHRVVGVRIWAPGVNIRDTWCSS